MKAPSYLPTPIQAINSTPDVRLSHRKFCQGKEVNYLLPRNTGITWDTLLLSFLCFSSARKESLVTLWSLQGQLDFCSLIHHSFFFQIPSIQFRSRTPKGASRSHRDNPLKLTPFIYKTELDNCCGIKRGCTYRPEAVPCYKFDWLQLTPWWMLISSGTGCCHRQVCHLGKYHLPVSSG